MINTYEIIEFWCSVLGISPSSEAYLGKYNQRLKFYIFDERNARHNRLHFHAFLNNEKVASIYLDNLEVELLSPRIKQGDKKKILEWVKSHGNLISQIRQKENGEFEIPFIGYS